VKNKLVEQQASLKNNRLLVREVRERTWLGYNTSWC